MKNLSIILFVLSLAACHSGKEEKLKPTGEGRAEKKVESKKAAGRQTENRTIAEFLAYNDDGDYPLLSARRKNELVSFINDHSDERSLLRGDLIEVVWKTDTVYIAGDGERAEQAQKIVSVKKIAEGKVSRFRKTYRKPLKYHWGEQENYAKSFLDKLYLVVEYYVAGSENPLLQSMIKNGEQINYSIENQTREAKEYVLIGISDIYEHHINTIQWLYYDTDNGKLYEYDLPEDSLIEFNR